MIVIHGDNIIESRQKLVSIINQAKEKDVLVERLNAQKLDVPTLEVKLQKTDLFGHSRMLIIEEFHSQRRSKKQTAMINMLNQAEMRVCLWEKRELTATMLKKLDADQVFKFKLANSLFNWLDSLSPRSNSKSKQIKLLHQAIQENSDYMCFVMLARQIRMLIQAATGGQVKGPYFVINKIKRQAKLFSLLQLLSLHQQLYQLDTAIKTSTQKLTLTQSLEHIIYKL